jgi:DNA-binding transcriptional ArsR family regulator
VRIQISAEDLRRIRVAPTLGPYAEAIFAFQIARQRLPNPIFSSWLRPLRMRLGHLAKPLNDIYACGPVIDLVSAVGPVTCIEEGIDNLRAVSRERLAAEVAWLEAQGAPSAAVLRLLDSDPEPRRQIECAISRFQSVSIGPHWSALRNRLDSETSGKIRTLGSGGVDHLLTTLWPSKIRWRPPVLEVLTPQHSNVSTIDLGGRGLTITPSVFIGNKVQVMFDPLDEAAPATLLYPVVRDLAAASRVLQNGTSGSRALADLLGRTRSIVLELIRDGCGTVELARRAGISPAAASEHAAVLRDAGLVSRIREGKSVLHSLTPLGVALLNGGKEAGESAAPNDRQALRSPPAGSGYFAADRNARTHPGS